MRRQAERDHDKKSKEGIFATEKYFAVEMSLEGRVRERERERGSSQETREGRMLKVLKIWSRSKEGSSGLGFRLVIKAIDFNKEQKEWKRNKS